MRPTLLLTRPRASAEDLVARIGPEHLQRVSVVISPLMQILPFGPAPDLTSYAGAVFTSANGVAHAPAGAGLPAYCVGQRTAAAALAAGWQVALTAQDADALVLRLRQVTNAPAPAPLLHLAGRFRRGDVAARLTAGGLPTDVSEVYDQQVLPLSASARAALQTEGLVIVPLFSPRTATQFAQEAIGATNRGATDVVVVAISAATADALDGFHAKTTLIADAPTAGAMLRAIENAIGRTSLA